MNLFTRKQFASMAIVLGAVAPMLISPIGNAAQFYASTATAVPGTGQPTAFSSTSLATDEGPQGAGDYAGSLDVYKLGNGGTITLGFQPGQAIYNGPGDDFTVFANPFYVTDSTTDFAELSFVEVSSDGVNFVRFPNYSSTPSPVGAYGTINAANVSGYAGVTPVLADTSMNPMDPNANSINPYDPTVSGGDSFDLSALANTPAVLDGLVNLNDIQYVRLVDVVSGVSTDSNGDIIYTPGSSADVDSLAVINGIVPEPASLALLGGAGLILVRRRRRTARL